MSTAQDDGPRVALTPKKAISRCLQWLLELMSTGQRLADAPIALS